MHRNLGYRVKVSTMIRISIDAPIRSRRGGGGLFGERDRLPQVLEGKEVHPAYQNRVQEAARKILR